MEDGKGKVYVPQISQMTLIKNMEDGKGKVEHGEKGLKGQKRWKWNFVPQISQMTLIKNMENGRWKREGGKWREGTTGTEGMEMELCSADLADDADKEHGRWERGNRNDK